MFLWSLVEDFHGCSISHEVYQRYIVETVILCKKFCFILHYCLFLRSLHFSTKMFAIFSYILFLQVLFEAKQWDFLVDQFKQEFCKLYGMTLEPLLNIYLQAGLSALKTPYPLTIWTVDYHLETLFLMLDSSMLCVDSHVYIYITETPRHPSQKFLKTLGDFPYPFEGINGF